MFSYPMFSAKYAAKPFSSGLSISRFVFSFIVSPPNNTIISSLFVNIFVNCSIKSAAFASYVYASGFPSTLTIGRLMDPTTDSRLNDRMSRTSTTLHVFALKASNALSTDTMVYLLSLRDGGPGMAFCFFATSEFIFLAASSSFNDGFAAISASRFAFFSFARRIVASSISLRAFKACSLAALERISMRLNSRSCSRFFIVFLPRSFSFHSFFFFRG
mmetsp:Transcript_37/g.140  ORF Transcript_37/g.140 Transcript_37/m.140 type:complete len:217 (+) Transcript_37:932-1582(+)